MAFNLILASSSKYRANILNRLQIPFQCQSPDIDESLQSNESPNHYVKRLSINKACIIAQKNTNSWVIGSDQIALFNGHILGKPGSHNNAVKQLTQFSGQKVEFITGVCLINLSVDICLYEKSLNEVFFKPLSESQIQSYLAKDQPYDCAGSFKIESGGAILFKRIINQDPTSLEGLPLITVCQLFEQAGVDLLQTHLL